MVRWPRQRPSNHEADAERKTMPAYVYMLRCADGSFHVGSTRATLETRLSEHNAGSFGGYTATRRPVNLVYHEAFERIDDAIAAEQQLKGWSRAKKEALIAVDAAQIKTLAKRRGGKPR